jgi:hypothetical protein
MGQMESCIICGKKTKLMFVCPNCNKTFCSEHRKQDKHNCEPISDEEQNIVAPQDTSVVSNSLLDEILEINDDVNDYEDSIELVDAPQLLYEDNIFDSSKNVNENKEIIEENQSDRKSIEKKIIENYEEKTIKNKDEFDLIDVPQFVYDEKIIESIKNKKEPEKLINENNKIEKSSNKKISKKIKDKNKIYELFNSKIVIIGVLLVLTISYFVMNGYLSSIFDMFDNSPSEDYNILFEKYSLIEERYNELYSDYLELEREYQTIKDSYNDLEEVIEESKEFDGEILIEQMKQITIPPGSNAVFFYEIPAPGYITIEYYSDIEIFSIVGSTLFEDVYYSRNPQESKSSELIFSVPVIPDINILFSNSDKENSATIFFKVLYYYVVDQ